MSSVKRKLEQMDAENKELEKKLANQEECLKHSNLKLKEKICRIYSTGQTAGSCFRRRKTKGTDGLYLETFYQITKESSFLNRRYLILPNLQLLFLT